MGIAINGECMRLSTFCVVVVGLAFVAGLAPALLAQVELAEPGIQIIPEDDPGLYNLAVIVHAASLVLALPLAALGLCLALVAEKRSIGIPRYIAVAALVAAPVGAIAMIAASATQNWDLYATLKEQEPMLAVVLLAGVVTLFLSKPAGRLPMIILAACSGVALAFGGYSEVILANSGVDNALHDTYFLVASDHAFGLSIALGALAALVGWVAGSNGRGMIVLSAIAGAALLFTGYQMIAIAQQLGLMGMPRRYVDYATPFADGHMQLSIWSFAFAAILIATLAGLAIFRLRWPTPNAADDAAD